MERKRLSFLQSVQSGLVNECQDQVDKLTAEIAAQPQAMKPIPGPVKVGIVKFSDLQRGGVLTAGFYDQKEQAELVGDCLRRAAEAGDVNRMVKLLTEMVTKRSANRGSGTEPLTEATVSCLKKFLDMGRIS